MSDVFTIGELREALGPRRPQYAELWVTLPSGRTICALINGDLGWLMVPREGDSADLVSRNPTYAGDPQAEIEYRLDNGQLDRYPAAWALPFADVQRALEAFLTNEALPAWVTWHEDSGHVRTTLVPGVLDHDSRETVIAKIRRIFPRRDPEDILALLDEYGADSSEPERDRVHLAILKICQEQGGSGLERLIRKAKTDYRDMLAWAEYPGQMSAEWQSGSPAERKRIIAEDRRQYDAWLNEQS